ncbi:hypothetical protein [Roseibium sp.]
MLGLQLQQTRDVKAVGTAKNNGTTDDGGDQNAECTDASFFARSRRRR